MELEVLVAAESTEATPRQSSRMARYWGLRFEGMDVFWFPAEPTTTAPCTWITSSRAASTPHRSSVQVGSAHTGQMAVS